MKLQQMSKKIFGAAFSLALVMGMGILTTDTASAQWPQWPNDQYRRNDDRDQRRRDRDDRRDDRRDGRRRSNDGYPNMGGSFDLRQTALNAGYNKGQQAGREDRNDNNRYDFRDEGDYQKASKDYSSRLGNKGLYQRYFRLAIENGYADGYQGY
jgi:hypothetical protein